jgi:Mg-chelatase subunit ChlD
MRRLRFALSLVATALVFGALGWLALDRAPEVSRALAARGVELQSPGALWLLVAIPFVWLARLYTLSDLPWLQRLASTLVRSAVLALLALALADPVQVSEKSVPVEVALVIDVSDSMTDAAIGRAGAIAAELAGARGDAALRVVAFDERAWEIPLAQDPGEPPRIARSASGGQHSDLETALHLALGLLSPEADRRVVLVTDGVETRGNAASAAEAAARFGVPIFPTALGDLEAMGELLVRGISVPSDLKPRVPFAVTAEVESTRAGAARCVLRVDGEEAGAQDVTLVFGAVTARWEDVRVGSGGEKHVAVACAPADGTEDRFATNNAFEVVVQVPEKPKVLYVEGKSGQSGDLMAALATEMEVTLRGPGGLPASSAALAEYDAVILSDVPVMGPYQRTNLEARHMEAIAAYVAQGGVFVAAGGESSFGPGGYGDTVLERKVLPVTMDDEQQRDTPELALALVIDKSGSMSGMKIELAKDAAKATVEALGRDDQIGVIAFDGEPETVVPLTRAANRLAILNNLSRLNTGGGTNIRPALEEAFDQLRRAEARTKHVILLSDGESDRAGIEALAQRMFQSRITVSTVAVGDGADSDLLGRIAGMAGGRAYRTRDPSNVPRIFLQETRELTRRSIVEERFVPRVVPRFQRLQLWRGLGSLPPLLGYVATRAKPSAEVLLLSHLGQPVLARMRIGLGWSIAWTSDVKARWSAPWVRWRGFPRFWRQLLRSSMPIDQETVWPVSARLARERLSLAADAIDSEDRFVNGLRVTAEVRDPGGRSTEVELSQTASGRYAGEVPAGVFGAWEARVEFADRETGEVVATGRASATYPYPDEHALMARQDEALLQALAARTGGAMDPAPAAVFAETGRTTRHTRPVRTPLLQLALALFVLDVFLRRVRLATAGEVPFFGKR